MINPPWNFCFYSPIIMHRAANEKPPNARCGGILAAIRRLFHGTPLRICSGLHSLPARRSRQRTGVVPLPPWRRPTALHGQMLTAKDRLNHCSLVMQDVNQYPLDVPGMKKLRAFFLPGLNWTGQLLLTKIIFCVELWPFLYLVLCKCHEQLCTPRGLIPSSRSW